MFVERNSTKQRQASFGRWSTQTRGFVSRFWQLLWQGPGAVSAYWSIPLPLVCTALSLAGPPELAGASLCILSVNVLLGVSLILVDEIGSCRNHDLGLLRLSAAKSRDRIAKLGIRSKQVDRFVNALWLNAELKCTFKKHPPRICRIDCPGSRLIKPNRIALWSLRPKSFRS